MSGLQGVPVRIEDAQDCSRDWGNALPILHEVRHAIERLVESGEETCIDLNGIPFGPGDEERLQALLGHGEVSASVDALGPTRVQETAIPGVWILDYRNAEDQRLALHLEIAGVPRILRTQAEDLETALTTLDARLESGPSPQS